MFRPPHRPTDHGAGATACNVCHASFPSQEDWLHHAVRTGHGLSQCAECGSFVAPDNLVGPLQRVLRETTAGPGECVVHHVVAPAHVHTLPSAHASSSEQTSPEETMKDCASRPHDTTMPSAVAYRCMSCLNTFPTWTRLTKHIDSTDHTLAKCAMCTKSLKCYGPLRPHRHTETSGHTGLWGPFYNRRDYAITSADQRTIFVAENAFTGHSVLQFECVCGVRFISEADLAIHLRRAHHVTSIADTAACTTCQLTGTLQEMAAHHTAANAIDGESARHELVFDGFHPARFLVHRPLSALGPSTKPWTLASKADTGDAVTTAEESSPFVVLYQCPHCYLLFSSWERTEQHLLVSGHCRAYCADCHRFLPNLRSFGDGDKSRQAGSGDTQRAMSPREYLEHIQKHSNVIGCPASREALEVLYHRQHGTCVLTPCTPLTSTVPPLTDRLDVPLETQRKDAATRDPVVFAFQCSTCNAVFLHYGELVAHLIALRHGERLEGSENGAAELVLDSLFPMVSYQVKFTSSQLCQNFGFVQCAACLHAVPPSEMPLHTALCQQVWIAKDAAAAATAKNPAH